MSVKSAPYYWLVCDICGERCEYGDFAAMQQKADAIDYAIDGDWAVIGEKHYCPNEGKHACEGCSGDAGELAGERDYLCPECWAKAEAEDAAAVSS